MSFFFLSGNGFHAVGFTCVVSDAQHIDAGLFAEVVNFVFCVAGNVQIDVFGDSLGEFIDRSSRNDGGVLNLFFAEVVHFQAILAGHA